MFSELSNFAALDIKYKLSVNKHIRFNKLKLCNNDTVQNAAIYYMTKRTLVRISMISENFCHNSIHSAHNYPLIACCRVGISPVMPLYVLWNLQTYLLFYMLIDFLNCGDHHFTVHQYLLSINCFGVDISEAHLLHINISRVSD